MKHIVWISGWGIDSQRFKEEVSAVLTNCHHTVYHPSASLFNTIKRERFDVLCGYSLGSLIVQKFASEQEVTQPIFLYAPFRSFTKENKEGGSTPLRNLQIMQKQLHKDPISTINNFYKFAQLPYRTDTLPYALEDLEWGLSFLETYRTESDCEYPSWFGVKDRLLDPTRTQEQFKLGSSVPNGGHYIGDLLPSSIHAF